jgi:hypothetical protein
LVIAANIFTKAAAFITLALGSGRMIANSEIAISTTKHMAGTDAASFLSYFGRLVSLNARLVVTDPLDAHLHYFQDRR